MTSVRQIWLRVVLSASFVTIVMWGPATAAPFPVNSSRFCPLGQVWPGYDPDWIESGTIVGDGQTFLTLIEPGAGCACSIGFQTSTLEFYMAPAEGTPAPFSITVSLGLREAIADPGGALTWVPGDVLCETPVRDSTFFIPKPFLGLGIALDCECTAIERPAFLFFTIHSTLDPPGGLYTSGGGKPGLNRNLTLIDGQWVDLVDVGILTRGDLVVSGSAQCCERPVAPLTESWGDVKARYR